MIYKLFDQKIRPGVIAKVNEVLAQELKHLKERKCIQGLKIIFGQQI